MQKITSSVIVLSVLMGSTHAFADKCKDVTIRVQNNGTRPINPTKMWYKFEIDNTERSEGLAQDLFHVQPGTIKTIDTRNLEYVKGYDAKYFKLKYKVVCGGKMSKPRTQKDTSFDLPKCVNGKTYRIDISDTTC